MKDTNSRKLHQKNTGSGRPGQLHLKQEQPVYSQQQSGLGLHIKGTEPSLSPVHYFGPVILGLDTDTGEPISVSQVDLCAGTYIDGVQRMGKTSLLEQVIYQQMERNEQSLSLTRTAILSTQLLLTCPLTN
jgi:hypothetical protein